MRILALSFLLVLSSGAMAQDHEHAAPPATPQQAPAPVQRFATDAPLRAGMHGIRAAVAGLGHYQMGHMGPEQAATLAAQVQAHVRDIIANCKLAPEADAALHLIIVPLMTNASALEADPKKLEAIAPMRAALAEYVLRFDDPEFGAVPADPDAPEAMHDH
jgi:hypothetical protein